jgi:Dynamin GTPase effector domain
MHIQAYNKIRQERGLAVTTVTLPTAPKLSNNVQHISHVQNDLAAMQRAYADVLAASHKQQQQFDQRASPGTEANMQQQAEDMACYLEAYWGIASERYTDNVSKAVRIVVLHELPDKLQSAALAMDADAVQRVMVEDAALVERRVHLTATVQRLSKALKILKRV